MTDKQEVKSIKDKIIAEQKAQIEFLQKENKTLTEELTHFKAKSLTYTKLYRDLHAENQSLKLEIKDMKFTRKYLTSEEAGKAFAQELLGGA